jgi:predicted O-methyltransferase YrrM
MKQITEYLLSRSGGLLKIEPEINDSTGKGYSMFNSGSVEVEVGEFLYGLVRVHKPQYILDTGTHYGVSAAYMAQALVDNNLGGQVISLEHDPFYHRQATDLWNNLGLFNMITGLLQDSKDHEPKFTYDLLLLDTEPQLRFNELVKFYPHLREGGFLFLHDLHRHMGQEEIPGHEFAWPWGILPEKIKELVRTRQLSPMHFSTSRGFTGFYKSDPRDFKW